MAVFLMLWLLFRIIFFSLPRISKHYKANRRDKVDEDEVDVDDLCYRRRRCLRHRHRFVVIIIINVFEVIVIYHYYAVPLCLYSHLLFMLRI